MAHTFDTPQWRAQTASALKTLELVRVDDVDGLRLLAREDILMALARAAVLDRELGMAGLALKAGSSNALAFVLDNPDWAASIAANAAHLSELTDRLAEAVALAPKCLPAVAMRDPRAAWLAASQRCGTHAERPTMRNTSETPDLSTKAIGDRQGAKTVRRVRSYSYAQTNQNADSFFKLCADLTPAENLISDALLAGIVVNALACGMALDSGPSGPGHPDTARAAIEAAEAMAAKGLRGGAFETLLLAWACTGRGQSKRALDLAETLFSPPRSMPMAIASDLLTFEMPHGSVLPKQTSIAWISAARAHTPEHAEITSRLCVLGSIAPEHTPSTALPKPSDTHPLSHLHAMWKHTAKAGRPLPSPAIEGAYAKFKTELAKFDFDWSSHSAPWSSQARRARALLAKGELSDGFPGGAPPTIESIVKSSRKLLSPLAWRLETTPELHHGGLLPTSSAAPASAALIHCARSSYACGFSAEKTLAELSERRRAQLPSLALAALDKTILEERTPMAPAASKSTRL